MASSVRWIDELFSVIDEKDTNGFLAFFADNASFRFGNAEPVIGRSAISDAVDDFFASIQACRHRIERTWCEDGATACHGTVTYTLSDGQRVTVPFANAMYHDGDNKIVRYLIHVDASPLFTR